MAPKRKRKPREKRSLQVIVHRVGEDGEHFVAYPLVADGEVTAITGSSAAEALGHFFQQRAEDLGVMIIHPSFDYMVRKFPGIPS